MTRVVVTKVAVILIDSAGYVIGMTRSEAAETADKIQRGLEIAVQLDATEDFAFRREIE